MMIWSYTNIPCLGLSTWCNRISWAVESSKTILDRRSAPSCMATRFSGNPNSSSINDLTTNNYVSLYYKGVTLCLLLLTVNLPEKLTVTHLVQKYPTSRREKIESFGMWCCIVEYFLTFPRNIVPSCSGSNSPKYLSIEDEGTMFLKNAVNSLPSGIASYPRRLESWATLLLSTSNIAEKITFKDRAYLLGWCALYNSFITEEQNTEVTK